MDEMKLIPETIEYNGETYIHIEKYTDLKKQLEATEKACIEWKKKYEEANKR